MKKDEIMVETVNIDSIYDWSRPTSVTKIWSIVRLEGYYRRFAKGFSTFLAPLM